MHLEYNVTRLKTQDNKYVKTFGHVVLNDDVKRVKAWPALSGGFGQGTIPIGIYAVTNITKLLDIPNNEPYKRDEFPWCAKLEPITHCIRTQLFIHADGNLPGTLGCLGITLNDIDCFNHIRGAMKVGEVLLYVL